MTDSASTHAPDAIILAAGKGKRMGGGDLPKVLYKVADRPMVRWTIDACRKAGVGRCILVVGLDSQQVRSELADCSDCRFVVQEQQLGTGHAARMAESLFMHAPDVDVFVIAADAPLLRPQTLQRLLQVHRETGAAATLATAVLDDPTGYGRIVRDDQGNFAAIVEQRDATPQQLEIHEINPSYYCFRAGALFDALSRVNRSNEQGEFYLTDVPALLRDQGLVVSLVEGAAAEDVLGVNTPEQLQQVDKIMRYRIAQERTTQAQETTP